MEPRNEGASNNDTISSYTDDIATNAKGGTNMHINIPSFLLKTYEIVQDTTFDDIISWNLEGNGFIVKQVN